MEGEVRYHMRWLNEIRFQIRPYHWMSLTMNPHHPSCIEARQKSTCFSDHFVYIHCYIAESHSVEEALCDLQFLLC